MVDTLVIRLLHRSRDDAATETQSLTSLAENMPLQAQWLLVDVAGGRLGMVMQGALAEAKTLALMRKVIVLIPGTEVSSTEPNLPIKRGAQLEQVARYALEESLASDVDDFHLAIGKHNSNGSAAVILVEHRAMREYLAELQAADIVADVIYAETETLPLVANGASLVLDRGLLYLRRGASPGIVLDIQPAAEALQFAANSIATSTPGETAADTVLYVTQLDYERGGAPLQEACAQIANLQIKTLPEGPLPLFALQATQHPALNLLTGPYVRKKSWDKTFAPWRIAAILFGVAVLLYLLSNGLQFWRLSRTEAVLDRQLRELVVQTLPGASASDIKNARRQFESRLSSLQSHRGVSGLLFGLNVLSGTLEQFPDVRIDALAFRNKVIDLRVTVPNVEALDRISHLAAEQGVTAEIQSATPRDNKIEGRLQLKASNI